MQVKRKLDAAVAYLERGWLLFTVNEGKRPWQNCAVCSPGAHDGWSCSCLFCHGFQAATADVHRLREMVEAKPEGLLALATGTVSGVVVVDAEGTDRARCGRTGVDVLEDWDWWGDTLRAHTSGGGLHLFYAYDVEAGRITSRNRVVSNIDIKGDGGYVVLPPAEGRRWHNWVKKDGAADPPQADLLAWMTSVKGGASVRRAGTSGGVMTGISPLPGERVPAGMRYEFTRNLVYKLRKQGVDLEEARIRCREWWLAYEQPPVAESELPWRQVEYELERAWARVQPEPPLADKLISWMKGLQDGN